jgi:iron complex outermembrane receptor protein
MPTTRKLIALFTAVAAFASPLHAQDLRVVSFNIRYDAAQDGLDRWPLRRPHVVDHLRRAAPELIGLQEVLRNQLDDLGALAGYASVGVGRDDGRDAGEFAPILYRSGRLTVLETSTFWFSDQPTVPGSRSWGNNVTRVCTWARFHDRATGTRFYVYNVHLDHQSQASRERSVASLLDSIRARRHADDPVLVTGDFNAGEDNPAVRAMVAVFRDTYRVAHPADTVVGTFNAFRGDSTGPKIDYIFAGEGWEVADAGIDRALSPEGRNLSDHFAVTARFRPTLGEPMELAAIAVTTTRVERRVEDQTLRVEVVDPEEVAEKVAMTPGDIAMLLNETGGLRVQNTSPALGAANVRVHGLRGRYTQLLADGLPMYGEAGALGILQIPPLDLLQVEIVKGAASALYGGGSLGGLVNLVSRRPLRDEGELLLNGSTLGGADAVYFGSRLFGGPWGGTLLAGVHGQQRVDQDGDGMTDVPGYRRVTLRPRLFFDNRAGTTLLATAGLLVERREGGTLPGDTVPDGLPYALDQRTTRFDAGVSAGRPLGERLALRARAAGMVASHQHVFGDTLDDDRHLSGLLEVTVGAPTGRLSWLAGAALSVERYRSDSVARFDYTYSAPGLFAQLDAAVSERLALQLSARVDQHSEYGTQASPRFSLLWRAVGSWTVRLSGGLGYSAPTPFVEETDAVGLRPLTIPNPLRAERGATLSADIGGTMGPLEVNATVFSSRISDPVQLDAVGTPCAGCSGPPPPVNLALQMAGQPVNSSGIDLVVRLVRAPLHVTASWVYAWSTEGACSTCQALREVPLNPRHTVALVAAVEQGGWRIGGEFYVTGAQQLDDNPYRVSSPAYAIVGALIRRRFGAAELFLNLENLGDVRQTRTDPLLRPAYSLRTGWTTEAWAPLDGRAVNGGVRLSL